MDRKGEYAAKFKDPRWQKMRLQILERDEWTCQRCFDSKSTLHVHHLWYAHGKDPWDYPETCLLTLCETCHEVETIELNDYAQDSVLMFKQLGAMSPEFQMLCNILAAQEFIGTSGASDEWSVIVHGLREAFYAHRARATSDQYEQLRERYYRWIKEGFDWSFRAKEAPDGEGEKH